MAPYWFRRPLRNTILVLTDGLNEKNAHPVIFSLALSERITHNDPIDGRNTAPSGRAPEMTRWLTRRTESLTSAGPEGNLHGVLHTKCSTFFDNLAVYHLRHLGALNIEQMGIVGDERVSAPADNQCKHGAFDFW